MSIQRPADESLPQRPSLPERIQGYAAAMMLVVAAAIVAGLPAPPPIPVSSPSETPVRDTPQPSPSIAVASELVAFPAVADTYVYAGRADLNYGDQTELRIDADPETLTYLQFTVSGIHQPVIGVSLRMHALGRQTQGFSVRTASTNWAESSITYGTRPADSGEVIGTSGLIAGEAAVEIKLTSAITGDGQYSFVLFTTSTTALAFPSREAGAATAPTLVVEVATGGGG